MCRHVEASPCINILFPIDETSHMVKVRCSAGGDYSGEWIQGRVGKLRTIPAIISAITQRCETL